MVVGYSQYFVRDSSFLKVFFFTLVCRWREDYMKPELLGLLTLFLTSLLLLYTTQLYPNIAYLVAHVDCTHVDHVVHRTKISTRYMLLLF